jgi:hypothetical protein
MRRTAMILVMGGALLAVGLYLFPMYYGQEMFVGWTTGMAGGNETMGVLWAAVLAGAVIVAGVAIVKPGVINVFGNPLYFAGAVVLVVLTAMFMLNGGSH